MNAEIEKVEQSIANLQNNLIGTAHNLQNNQNGLQEQIINLDHKKMDKNIDVGFKIEVGQVYENLEWVGAENLITITEIVEEKFDCIRFTYEEKFISDKSPTGTIIQNGTGILDTTTNEITLHVKHHLRNTSVLIMCYIQDSETFQGKKIVSASEEYDGGIFISYWKKVK